MIKPGLLNTFRRFSLLIILEPLHTLQVTRFRFTSLHYEKKHMFSLQNARSVALPAVGTLVKIGSRRRLLTSPLTHFPLAYISLTPSSSLIVV